MERSSAMSMGPILQCCLELGEALNRADVLSEPFVQFAAHPPGVRGGVEQRRERRLLARFHLRYQLRREHRKAGISVARGRVALHLCRDQAEVAARPMRGIGHEDQMSKAGAERHSKEPLERKLAIDVGVEQYERLRAELR